MEADNQNQPSQEVSPSGGSPKSAPKKMFPLWGGDIESARRVHQIIYKPESQLTATERALKHYYIVNHITYSFGAYVIFKISRRLLLRFHSQANDGYKKPLLYRMVSRPFHYLYMVPLSMIVGGIWATASLRQRIVEEDSFNEIHYHNVTKQQQEALQPSF
eukprot:TRINITY_DN2727_c0_g1_i1.p1 TRINITY_DN2727_c0_g1~~TRINITY_DN2727_c0_g1_i1.p1  ORF type:complete len:168 (+),score=16.69 TRINITY_DN2727_c0_g1_i1:24-506(+)